MSELLKINVNEVLASAFGGGKCARVVVGDTEFAFRLLSATATANNYGVLRLKDASGSFRTVYLHRAVCELFNGSSDGGLHVRHLDCDKTNNKASNLAWGTPKENASDGVRNGKIKRGHDNPCSRLTFEQAQEARRLRATTNMTLAHIAEVFGVARMTVARAIQRGEGNV